MTLHYAVGDPHGCSDLLAAMYARIDDDRRRAGAETATVVLLGDYVDRGPDSLGVIDLAMAGAPGMTTIALKGNHEAMLAACLRSDDPMFWHFWVENGGDAALRSFDLAPETRDPEALAAALGPERVSWLERLPLTHGTPDWLFVHAGVAPGVPLARQTERDLLWIRGPFLESDEDFGVRVVHGHTPEDAVDIRPNRINVDIGSFFSGRLGAVALAPDAAPRPLVVAL